MPDENKRSDEILTGVLNTNSFGQWIVKGKGMKESVVVGNPGRITNSQKYKLQQVRFTLDGHFAWLI